MALPHTISAYVDQYVKTATDGNVQVTYAQLVDRMQLACTVCQQTLTCPLPPSDAEMDWAMQEFVKLHRHVAVQLEKKYTTISKPILVTADFKSVKKDDWGISTGRKFR